MKCFNDFSQTSPNIHNWPLSKNSIQEFITWAAVVRKLKSNTIKSYLSSLNLAHKFRDLSGENCVGFTAKMLLRGIENLEFYVDISKESRKAMSLPLLKLIGHELAKADWTVDKKVTVWAACTTAFFGSFRLGEILSKSKNVTPAETLLWSDMVFRDNSVTIHIRIPKNRCPSGEFVDIFEFKNHNCCPVAALKSLKKLKTNPSSSPVFFFSDFSPLTPLLLTNVIQSFLSPHIGQDAKFLSGHSFRSGIPSILSNCPDLANDEEIKLWGRWNSTSYKLYTRLHLEKKRAVFNKVVSVLNRTSN